MSRLSVKPITAYLIRTRKESIHCEPRCPVCKTKIVLAEQYYAKHGLETHVRCGKLLKAEGSDV